MGCSLDIKVYMLYVAMWVKMDTSAVNVSCDLYRLTCTVAIKHAH